MASRTVLGVALVASLWAVGLLAAPFLLPAHTVGPLDGRANFMDHGDTWRSMPWLPAAVYSVGDFVCHQMAGRSWTLHGNQLPVDVRLLAASLGAPFGLLAAAFVRPSARLRDTLARLTTHRSAAKAVHGRGRHVAAAWAVALLPTALDGGLELFTGYESTGALRFATGLLLGCFALFLAAQTMRSLFTDEADGPRSARQARGRPAG